MGTSQSSGMENTLFQLKFTERKLQKFAAKAEKEQNANKAKVKKALQQRNVEGARIYAENAVRKKNESLNFLRFAARIDAVSSRVKTGVSMMHVAKDIKGVCVSLDHAMASNDLPKLEQIMSKFEKQFEDLDVRTATMDQAMGAAVTLTTPADQVDALITQVADENGLEVADKLHDLRPPTAAIASTSRTTEQDRENDLTKRLQTLRQ